MTHDMIEAAVALADTLARENAALRALDLPRAMALLAGKHRASDAFEAARLRLPPDGGPDAASLRRLAGQLRQLAEENRLLLEHAMRVQGSVIATFAAAVPKGFATTPRYVAGGAMAEAPRATPIALSARA
ncbi:MAG: hypothetical protein KGJ41_12555 [Rhodospirillales bacterium]|nr:hypothetical protein [Rhodospirillales bacterium]MDE2577047.1 hypothetical protein [Rhodospirillales bacterium]